MRPDPAAVQAVILRLTAALGPGKSICPSEAARALSENWQGLLGDVRQAAIGLAKSGRIDILHKGKPVDPDHVRGVVRLRIRPAQEQQDLGHDHGQNIERRGAA